MMNWVWGIMMLMPLAYGACTGRTTEIIQTMLLGTTDAVELTLKMAGGFALWCGLMEILRQGGAMDWLGKQMEPVMRRLFPGVKNQAAFSAIAMNLAANMLGLGNAATPMGLKAMSLLAKENARRNKASRAMWMLLVLNSCCVQLVPSTVLTLRTAAGSQMPGAVMAPTLVSTLVSAAVGVALCLIWGRGQGDE
ncbi:MAG: spore maturation protein [Clostridia bacterium]|nr:spore maturation protein [Clostridia bacterium]